MNIPFLDLKANYNSIKSEVDSAIQNVLDNTAYILGHPFKILRKILRLPNRLNIVSEQVPELTRIIWCFGD